MSLTGKIRKEVFKLGIRLICAGLFAGCLTPVDLHIQQTGNKLVVSGQVSPIEDQNIIQLGRTADSERLPIPLSGAQITLFDDAGEAYLYQETLSTLGVYILTGVSGIPGRTYYIRIVLSGDEIYKSKPEKMAENVGEISTYYEIAREEFVDSEGTVSKQPFMNIYGNANLPNNNFIKWNVEEVYKLIPSGFPDRSGATQPPCFISQNADPQRVSLLNGTELNASLINSLLVCSRIIDYSFWERHYFTTYQSSLTKEAFVYWQKVNILANQTGSIFDTPPAEITGNMYKDNDSAEKVFGYFQAVNQTFDRLYILNSDLPFPLLWTNCSQTNIPEFYPYRCIDCLSVRNSSYNRPSWF